MARTDDYKQIAVANPAGVLDVMQRNIAKQIDESAKTPADLRKLFTRTKDRMSENLLLKADEEASIWEDPAIREQVRQDIVKDRGLGPYNPETLRKGLSALGTTDRAALKAKDAAAQLFKTQEDRELGFQMQEKLGELEQGGFSPTTPKYRKNLEAMLTEIRSGSHNIPGIQDAYNKIFASDPSIKLTTATATDTSSAHPEMDAAIKAVGGDWKNPTDWNSAAFNKAVNTKADAMQIEYPGIQNRQIFVDRATNLINESPAGEKFRRGRAKEATTTIHSQALEGFATQISDGVNAWATAATPELKVAANEVVVKSLNSLLSYMNKNNIKDPFYDDIVLRTLERTPLTSVDALKAVGVADPESMEVIDTGIQRKVKKHIRDTYIGTYPELGDRLLKAAHDRIINSGPDSISVAMQIGQANAATRAKQRKLRADSRFKIYAENLQIRNDIKNRGLIPHITDNLFQQFKTKFPNQEMRSEDDARLKDQVGELVDRLQTHIGKNLKGEQKDAFRLTARRMIMEHATWDEHTNWFGFRWPTVMGAGADFGVLKKGTPMSDENKLAVMELFHASIIDPDIIAKAKGNDAKIRQGAIMLEKSMADKIKTLEGNVRKRLEELKNAGTNEDLGLTAIQGRSNPATFDLGPLGFMEKALYPYFRKPNIGQSSISEE